MKFNQKLDRIYFDPRKVREMNQASDEAVKAYDALQGPPVSSLLTAEDISALGNLIMSPYYQTHVTKRREEMNKIMGARGFRFLHGGTNRVFYIHNLYPNIGAKVALDNVGLKNNIDELYHQHIIKPFCSKVFDVSKDQFGRLNGIVASCEAVYPIRSLIEFREVANQIFAVLWYKLKMKRIAMTDIGARSFKNWGIRPGFGPVMLDYPTMTVIDDTKCYCRVCNEYGQYCGGKIDYSDSFDQMICLRCGTDYQIKAIAKLNGEDMNELLRASGMMVQTKQEVSHMKVKFRNPVTGRVVTNVSSKEANTYVAPDSSYDSTANIGSVHVKCKSRVKELMGETTVVQPEPVVVEPVEEVVSEPVSKPEPVVEATVVEEKTLDPEIAAILNEDPKKEEVVVEETTVVHPEPYPEPEEVIAEPVEEESDDNEPKPEEEITQEEYAEFEETNKKGIPLNDVMNALHAGIAAEEEKERKQKKTEPEKPKAVPTASVQFEDPLENLGKKNYPAPKQPGKKNREQRRLDNKKRKHNRIDDSNIGSF